MKKEEVIKSIQSGKLQRRRNWFEDIMGLYPFLFFWGVSIILLVAPDSDRNPLKVLFFYVSGVGFCWGIYSLTQENYLTKVETDLEATLNYQMVVKTFQDLSWEVDLNADYMVTAHIKNPYGFIGQYITALIENNNIYLNVKQKGTFKGRIPFFFGYNQKRLNQVGDKIMQSMHLIEQEKSINSLTYQKSSTIKSDIAGTI